MKPFYVDPQWSHITDWESELGPHYDQASRMLGVVTNPSVTPSDVVMKGVAEDMGVPESYHPTPVGVYFGKPGSAPRIRTSAARAPRAPAAPNAAPA